MGWTHLANFGLELFVEAQEKFKRRVNMISIKIFYRNINFWVSNMKSAIARIKSGPIVIVGFNSTIGLYTAYNIFKDRNVKIILGI